MQLHNFFRSSASYRVRIALNLKGLAFDYLPVHLSRDGGEQFGPAYRALSPEALVPVWQNGEVSLHQSLAIIEYLDERYPTPPLLPGDALGRACVRALALDIACEIHPLNNLRVLNYLSGPAGLSAEARQAWYHHWIHTGFGALETRLATARTTGRYCYGDTPTLADIALVPQIFNAQRFEVDLSAYPTLMRINEQCLQLPAFSQAEPAQQPDAQP
ncbi:maleylacetoacetate isomerase [Paraburkholderia bonniea]|uniref:maleylacetoacetate isomerase n=1 Tax=Paraburkholderia bonniea TaxID=2152891 RepID=UPI0012916584|nr:maleylacetoacetate isomerase [Paraburkholderia bonniea]WJF91935.1 maleylacetoacetate isomerase [Paraburkholderia bonniea]WJF95254.1 maleylacetoacetate isomerase [Paraburkholderia bonniea]